MREVLGQYFGLLSDNGQLTEEQKKNMTKEQEQRYQEKKQQEESEKQVNYGVKPIN